MLNGIQNFLAFVNDNWTAIVVIASLCIALWRKIKAYLAQSDDQKIAIAKAQIQQAMLKWIADAEVDYEDWTKAGSVKRSQVIQLIFKEYPILSKITDQDSVIAWIDDAIDASLKELRKIVAENKVE